MLRTKMNLSELSVFVYGTLKPGGRYWPEFCEGKVGEPIPAKIRGALYDLHVGYPGLWLGEPNFASTTQAEALPITSSRPGRSRPLPSARPGRSRALPRGEWALGYVLAFEREEDFLRLDGLEGYHPDLPYSENEYIRKKVSAYSMEGDPLGEVWAYEITEHVMERCRGTLIVDGDWPV
ncbi:MAG: gamma-glutamylcyclotransferase family protein [Opitutales bacterium]